MLKEENYKKSEELFLCSKCGNQLGFAIIINNERFIKIGGLILKDAHGICSKCHSGFHYSISEKKLQMIFNQFCRY